jgi:Na+-transporting NADH:ubiquinone oxidoreductase subunit F
LYVIWIHSLDYNSNQNIIKAMQFILASILVFLVTILVLVAVLLIAKRYLSPSGNVNIVINDDKSLSVEQGSSLLSTLAEQGVHLASACGGKGSCGQCRVQVMEGGGEVLDTERPHFTRKEIKNHWRLGCQLKVRGPLKIKVPESILGVKEWECTVISNKNVSSFIKEFIVALPQGEHMDFVPGSYAQILIPAYDCIDYDRDFSKEDIGEEYIGAWNKFNIFSLKAHNPETTVRAYSMANYPAEGDRITLTVRIATTPFKPRPQVGFQDLPTGIASSYIFSRKPGDKVIMSGPYGDFHPVFDSKKEMIWIGGGAGMAPLRSQIMHMLKTLHTRDREMHYFYGARSLSEAFFIEDFQELEKEYPNFHFHLALDRPDPKADEAGVPYTAGFVAPVLYDTYLKNHDAPEDIEYYLCGPPMMAKTVLDVLDSLGVEPENIRFDNFG